MFTSVYSNSTKMDSIMDSIIIYIILLHTKVFCLQVLLIIGLKQTSTLLQFQKAICQIVANMAAHNGIKQRECSVLECRPCNSVFNTYFTLKMYLCATQTSLDIDVRLQMFFKQSVTYNIWLKNSPWTTAPS